MDSKKYKTKEEIAKEFDILPERKSKIASIQNSGDGTFYCICRSSQANGFMICCDSCEEWFHGDCVKITEKEAKNIKKYYCHRCKSIDGSLTTVFKSSIVHAGNQSSSKDVLKKKKYKDVRCGHCDGCRSKMMGKKGKCEKRNKKIQKEQKIKDGRVK
jgi:COMPASS component SPP1